MNSITSLMNMISTEAHDGPSTGCMDRLTTSEHLEACGAGQTYKNLPIWAAIPILPAKPRVLRPKPIFFTDPKTGSDKFIWV